MRLDWFRAWRLNRDVLRGVVTSGLLAFAYFGVQGVLLNLYLLRLGFDIQTIGLLIGTGQFIWGLLALPAALIGQRWGLRAAIVAGYGLTTLGIGLVLTIEWVAPAWQVPYVFGAWIVLWTGAALNTVNARPYLMLAASDDERRHAFAAQSAVMALCGLAGGILAGVLSNRAVGWLGTTPDDPAPYRLVLWLVPLVYLLGGWTMAGARPLRAPAQAPGERREAPAWKLFLFLGLVIFLIAAGEGVARAFFNIYLDQGLGMDPGSIGVIMGIGQGLPVVAALFAPALMQRFGAAGTMVLTSLVVGSAFIVLGTEPHWLVAALAYAVYAAMVAVNGTARNVFGQELFAAQWRPAASAVQTMGVAFGWGIAAVVGGFIIQAVGFRALFLGGAGLALVGAVILLVGIRGRRQPVPSVEGGSAG